VSEQEEDFAAMFAASVKARRFDRGQTIEGTLVGFGPEVAFVNLGGKAEAEIDLAELKDADGNIEVSVGDRIQAKVVSTGGGIVLSRRGVRNAAPQRELQGQQRAGAAAARTSIVPGAVLRGRVVSVPAFGAFVDLGGGIQGLLHVSEMSWSRVANPNDIVAPGDQITVQVLRVDDATQKIALGLKQLLDDPWTTVATTYAVGDVRTGRVTRVADFGAFVELAPGVEGLAHASTFVPTGRRGGWAAALAVGATGAFEILSIDTAQKRLGIALVDEGSSRAAGAASPKDALVTGAIVTGKVERHEKFGVFVFLSPGRTGLMPFAETGLDRDTDMLKAFPIGSEVEVAVLEIDPSARRIRLSRKAVAAQREQAELREYAARPDAASTTPMGSLADNLRNALKGR
jgi:small subunit ribosomal protein S1